MNENTEAASGKSTRGGEGGDENTMDQLESTRIKVVSARAGRRSAGASAPTSSSSAYSASVKAGVIRALRVRDS